MNFLPGVRAVLINEKNNEAGCYDENHPSGPDLPPALTQPLEPAIHGLTIESHKSNP